MTPDEELEHLNAELERFQIEHPNQLGILQLTEQSLRRCSKWKWEQHGWYISDGQTCGIMNGDDRERRTALLSFLNEYIQKIEIVPNLEIARIVPSPSKSSSKGTLRD